MAEKEGSGRDTGLVCMHEWGSEDGHGVLG